MERGIPWLGFIVYPQYRPIKARNVRHFSARLRDRWQAFCREPSALPNLTAAFRDGSIMCATPIAGDYASMYWVNR
ncbi:hypothetical protein [Nitrosomonas communis]|uniref:hypothetical protein n=1 Tax=Nitrosomonas communis TaxID=44574 RepID=UPI0015A71657|nr:hypothetical protein [Nitrosomonas communis]